MDWTGAVSKKLCYPLAESFLQPPLKQFGFGSSRITRFDSMDNYVADRVSNLHEYAELFDRFVSMKGKIIPELGCNKGYLLQSV